MTELKFDPDAPILVFKCVIEYRSRLIADLALDTGASKTIIREKLLEAVGFDLKEVTTYSTFGDATETHLVPEVTLRAFALGPEKVENVQCLAYTIPEEHGIDGVIGLNFLRHFNMSLDFQKGVLTLDRARQ